ncbi:hypothetical protein VKT23_014541 [Stygiomarasmius scandens]|uniref:Uncharacterized protein n=1 Tax=Marasmiellus scandens TaxID=2682957 RepID=A0ABR1J0K7_9AGAR
MPQTPKPSKTRPMGPWKSQSGHQGSSDSADSQTKKSSKKKDPIRIPRAEVPGDVKGT